MGQKWYEIWNRRNSENLDSLELKDLIALNGFDSGAGKIEEEDWREYARWVSKKLELSQSNSIFEVGCGCGAFLFALRDCVELEVGGIDYGAGLIKTAKSIFPEGDFQCLEAAQMDLSKKYDFVISNSVFHYFDESYAYDVLVKMLQKSIKGVCILEIPDINKKSEAEKLRRNIMSVEAYEKKYAGLHHTYYDREWFVNFAKDQGFQCEIFNGCIPNYQQNFFRFGCLISKH